MKPEVEEAVTTVVEIVRSRRLGVGDVVSALWPKLAGDTKDELGRQGLLHLAAARLVSAEIGREGAPPSGGFKTRRVGGVVGPSVLNRDVRVGGARKPLAEFTVADLDLFISEASDMEGRARRRKAWGKKARSLLAGSRADTLGALPAKAQKTLEEADW